VIGSMTWLPGALADRRLAASVRTEQIVAWLHAT
jgi:hypothetical protein